MIAFMIIINILQIQQGVDKLIHKGYFENNKE